MSWQIAAWALRQRTELSGEHHVLLVLATFADKSGTAWPSHQMLADVTRQSPDSVQRHLQALEDAGLISVERRKGHASLYKFPMTKPHLAASGGRTLRPVHPQSAVTDQPHSARSRTVRGVGTANDGRGTAKSHEDLPQMALEQTAISPAANSRSSKNTSQHTSLNTSLSEASYGASADTANFTGSFVRSDGAHEPVKDTADTAQEAPRPSYDDLAAKYPDLLRPKLKRMPTDDHPIDQRWQATPEPSASLVRIELAKKLQRAVSDAEVEQYIAQRKANP